MPTDEISLTSTMALGRKDLKGRCTCLDPHAPMEDGGQPPKRHDKLGYGLTKFGYINESSLSFAQINAFSYAFVAKLRSS